MPPAAPRPPVGPRRRTGVALAVVGALAVLGDAAPAAAHGVGSRSDLPVPLWMVTWGATAALVVSFAALGAGWRRPLLARLAAGEPAPAVVDHLRRVVAVAARVVGLAMWSLTLVAAWVGTDTVVANIAPTAVFIIFWVGVQLASALLGDIWAAFDPHDTILRLAGRSGRRPSPRAERWGRWPAVAMVAVFLWMELAFHDGARPRALAVWLTAHSAVALAAGWRWGPGWLARGEGFRSLFGLIAALAPLTVREGRLRVRPPLAGLSTLRPVPGTAALVLVVLGGTGFDGLTRTRWWLEVAGSRRGWELTILNTVGLVWMIAVVTALYAGAVRVASRRLGSPAGGPRGVRDLTEAFAPSLVPIAVGYAVAHYFSLLFLEGQAFIALLSDPLGRGWDLFGTVTRSVNYQLVGPTTIAWVQAAAIVVGHVAGVVAAHDRALERARDPGTAARSQHAMLVVMVLYTVGGLRLLLG